MPTRKKKTDPENPEEVMQETTGLVPEAEDGTSGAHPGGGPGGAESGDDAGVVIEEAQAASLSPDGGNRPVADGSVSREPTLETLREDPAPLEEGTLPGADDGELPTPAEDGAGPCPLGSSLSDSDADLPEAEEDEAAGGVLTLPLGDGEEAIADSAYKAEGVILERGDGEDVAALTPRMQAEDGGEHQTNGSGGGKTEAPVKKRATAKKKAKTAEGAPTETKAKRRVAPESEPASARLGQPDILSIERGDEIEAPEEQEDAIWHNIQNFNRTKRMLTGTVGGIERTENGKPYAVIYYHGLRVIVPASEMVLGIIQDDRHQYGDLAERQYKIMNHMLGAEVDFVIKGIDKPSRSVVASRREAMLRKCQNFYFKPDPYGRPMVRVDRMVQARIVAVAEKVLRVEVFGVETSLLSRDISWDWVGDARERYSVGDVILVKVMGLSGTGPDNVSISVSAKEVTSNTAREQLKKIHIQGKYAGEVTDVRKGVVYIRLAIGVNAVAHACYDTRRPGKRDEVSFAVTQIDFDRGNALGVITRIIKRHI